MINYSKVLDLSQDFSIHSPAFAGYMGPQLRWIKRLAFDKGGGQELLTTMHVSTHLDSPAHFQSSGKFIGDMPIDWLVGPACVVDLERMGLGDFDIYGPEHFEQWEKDTGITIERGDILIIHTGYHKYYPENWTDRSLSDETRYFMRHPGPGRAFAEWCIERGIRYIAVDAGSADHPMNTIIRKLRPDEADKAAEKFGKPLTEVLPDEDYQVMHIDLFPHDIIHVENLGGDIDKVLDQRITFGTFPWRFMDGEAAMCRCVAFLD